MEGRVNGPGIVLPVRDCAMRSLARYGWLVVLALAAWKPTRGEHRSGPWLSMMNAHGMRARFARLLASAGFTSHKVVASARADTTDYYSLFLLAKWLND